MVPKRVFSYNLTILSAEPDNQSLYHVAFHSTASQVNDDTPEQFIRLLSEGMDRAVSRLGRVFSIQALVAV